MIRGPPRSTLFPSPTLFRSVERRAEPRGVRDLAADATADARLVHGGDRILAQRVGVLPERERRAAVQTHAGVVARADVGVHPEARLDDLGARGDRLPDARLLTALALEHALVPRDDDLEAGHSRRERLAERPDNLRDPAGVHGSV